MVNHTKGPVLAPALGHGLDFHLGNLYPMAYCGRTLKTTHRGCILEFTYLGGPVPSLIINHG
jgi:hypothetical protein